MIVLLHGALGSEKQLEPIKNKLLGQGYRVKTLNFVGHGGKATDQKLSIPVFAHQLKALLAEEQNEEVNIFGFSMGGYVALYLASLGQLQAKKIITLGTKFNWSPESAKQEIAQLNPEKIKLKVPAFAAYLESLHGAEWPLLLHKTAQMMEEMGSNPPLTETNLSVINIPVTVMRGEKDIMVSEAETLWAGQHLINSNYVSIQDWPHPIDRIPTESLIEVLKTYL